MQYIRLLILAALCVANLTLAPSVSAQDTERPIPISAPRPPYPPIARAKRISGTVFVDVRVNSEGKVVEAKVVMGHELLREHARKAALGFRFKPFDLAGDMFTVRLTYIFHDESYTAPEKEPDFTSPYQVEIPRP
jgi:TonB family protein